MGPTAIGKTSAAIRLNQFLNSIIISADSRQVYKELSIGTAKPSSDEIISGNIKLVDHVSIKEHYTAGRFEKEADELISRAFANSEIPILCGGTGLYIKAVCEGLDVFPKVKNQVNIALQKEFEENGLEDFLTELKEGDPLYYNAADVQNPQRVMRALGVMRSSGLPFSSFLSKKASRVKKYKPIYLIFEEERAILYSKINSRVDRMFEKGLVSEVEKLVPFKNLKALQTVGYAEIFKYLEGQYSLEQSKNEIKKNTRRYAKRQMTWLRNQVDGHRLQVNDTDQIMATISQVLK